MRTKALARLAIVMLIVAISCTKESSNIAPSTTATATGESQDLLAQSLDNEANYVQVVGKWALNFDWFCDGISGTTTMIVNSDGNWRMPHFNYTGRWVKGRKIFLFTFDGIGTTYSGVIFDKKIKGIMTSWDGIQSCFHMDPDEANSLNQEELTNETID